MRRRGQGGGEGRDDQGRDRGRGPIRSVTLRRGKARKGGGVSLKRRRTKLPPYLGSGLVKEVENAQDVRMDASKDTLVHPMLGRVDRAKGIKVVFPVAPTPSSKSISLPITLAVLRGDDASGHILQCGVRFNLKRIDAKGASGNEMLLNELPKVPIWPKSIRFKRTQPMPRKRTRVPQLAD